MEDVNRLLKGPRAVFEAVASSVAWYYEKILQRAGEHVRRRR